MANIEDIVPFCRNAVKNFQIQFSSSRRSVLALISDGTEKSMEERPKSVIAAASGATERLNCPPTKRRRKVASQVRSSPVYESNAREIALDPVNKLIDEIIQANAG